MDKSNVISKYETFMKKKNKSHEYDKILNTLKFKHNGQVSDLMNAMIKHGDKTKVQPLIQELNKSPILDNLIDFLKRKNED